MIIEKLNFSLKNSLGDWSPLINQVEPDGFWLNFNPYTSVSESKRLVKEFEIGDEFTDGNLVIRLKTKGGAGYFGKDSFSWEWLKFEIVSQ